MNWEAFWFLAAAMVLLAFLGGLSNRPGVVAWAVVVGLLGLAFGVQWVSEEFGRTFASGIWASLELVFGGLLAFVGSYALGIYAREGA